MLLYIIKYLDYIIIIHYILYYCHELAPSSHKDTDTQRVVTLSHCTLLYIVFGAFSIHIFILYTLIIYFSSVFIGTYFCLCAAVTPEFLFWGINKRLSYIILLNTFSSLDTEEFIRGPLPPVYLHPPGCFSTLRSSCSLHNCLIVFQSGF